MPLCRGRVSLSLRNARDFRFRDTNVLALNLAYRWEAFSGLDMAGTWELVGLERNP